jgi:hypothetical protein
MADDLFTGIDPLPKKPEPTGFHVGDEVVIDNGEAIHTIYFFTLDGQNAYVEASPGFYPDKMLKVALTRLTKITREVK